MRLGKLDHVNIRTAKLDSMIDWYERVLGMRKGPRPPFRFPGAWLYCGDDAAVHLIGVEADPETKELRIEHFAFAATGLAGFLARLDREGVSYRTRRVPELGTLQVNLRDPDDNHLHVDFTAEEADGMAG